VAASARELLDLINNVLDYANLDAQTVKAEQQEFDLSESMTVLRDKFRNEARNRGLALRLHLSPEIPPWLHGDAKRVIQVLKHLIANAIKFTAKGEISLTVVPMKAEADRTLIRFAVTDTGIGIPAEARDRIFKPFSQADGSRARRHGGAGVGLVLCKRITELLGGEIGFTSEEGRGSTFWFTCWLGIAGPRPSTKRATEPEIARAS
jgi:two-component system sensor histidine kinase/response regulator